MYKIGDKVETPLGIGVIQSLEETIFEDEKGNPIYDYAVKFENDYDYYTEHKLDKIIFLNHVVKPYRTAHEKLIEMGYERVEDEDDDCFVYRKGLDYVTITKDGQVAVHDKNTYFGASYFNITLSRILTQYLEELE